MRKLIKLVKKFNAGLEICYYKNSFGQWLWSCKVNYLLVTMDTSGETLRLAIRKMIRKLKGQDEYKRG